MKMVLMKTWREEKEKAPRRSKRIEAEC